MVKLLSFIFFCVSTSFLSAQDEEAVPLSGNPQLMSNFKNEISKVNTGTFDSTFIYSLDTLSLPIFDDFSTDKFQKFNAQFTDPGVTFDKVYHLLDNFGVVISNNTVFTEQVTFYRQIDVGSNTITDVDFAPTEIKKGDLTSYPVTHVPTLVYPNFYIYDT